MENKDMKSAAGELVSVIVPCYNYAHFLPDTLNSILNQTYPHWECIIVNDGSTDDTARVAQQYVGKDARFKYVYQQNKGLSAARNTGIASSRGEYLQLLDADDLIEPQKLERQVAYLRRNSGVDIVYSDARFFVAAPGEVVESGIEKYICRASGQGEELLARILEKNITVVSAPLFRKTVVARAGVFDEGLRAVEDYDFWLRCALNGCTFQHHIDGSNDATLIRKGHISMSFDSYRMLRNNVRVRLKLKRSLQNNTLQRLNALYLDHDVHFYGDQLYKAAVYVDFKKYGRQLMRAVVGVKHTYLVRILLAAAFDKLLQMVSAAAKTGLKTGKA